MSDQCRPPALARALLRLLPAEDRDEALADMAELFAARVESIGERAARRWYTVHALRLVVMLRWEQLRAGRRTAGKSGMWAWLADLGQDARHALRTLRRNPGFAAAAILTLALGLGANVAIFSVLDAALLRPLPYRDPDSLVDIFVTGSNPRGEAVQVMAGGREIERLRAFASVFARIEAYSGPTPRSRSEFERRLEIGAISASLPEFLGVAPQLGRTFSDDDLVAGDRIILSDKYWRSAYSRGRDVLGKTLSFSDRTYVVVGVMPESFRYFVGAQADGWIPLGDRDARRVVARLRPGLSRDQAQQELRAALAAPDVTWKPRGVEIVPADWMRAGGVYSVNGRATRTMLYTLVGAVGLLLAIACANVANLLLARTLSREREIAVRGSLGASRWRLARQFLTEGMVLTGLGSLVAIVVAWWILEALPLAMPADLTASAFGAAWPELDTRALGFVCAAAILTGALCGAAPAIRVSRRAASTGVLGRGRRVAGLSRGERRVRAAFQALQVAMTLVLLAGAGLLLTSLLRMVIMPPGFDSRNLGYAGWTSQRSVDNSAFLDELIARTLAIPGVTAATAGMPPVSGFTDATFLVEDIGPSAPVLPLESFYVRPDYFQFGGIPLLEGRPFGAADREHAEPVAIVSEAAARRLWPGQSSLGRRFRPYPGEPLVTIVGVVPSVRTVVFTRDGVQAYRPAAQTGDLPYLLFRVAGDPRLPMTAIREQIRAMNPSITVHSLGMVDNLASEFDPIGPTRFYAMSLGSFAVVGLLTAVVGLYGVISYAVSRRTHEIGIRLVLGARLAQVRRLVFTEALVPVAVGVVGGVTTSLWLSRVLESRLFQVAPNDPLVLAGIVVVLLAACALAVVVPVRRATRIAPGDALRAE